MKNVIYLTKVIDEVESNPPSLRWVENEELQEEDMLNAIRLVKGIFAGVVFSLTMIAISMLLSGCASQSLDDDEYWDAVDGGGEPMGWGMTQDISTAEESYRAKR